MVLNTQRVADLTALATVAQMLLGVSGVISPHLPLVILSGQGPVARQSHVTAHQWPLVRPLQALSSFCSPQPPRDCLFSSLVPAAATPHLLSPWYPPA